MNEEERQKESYLSDEEVEVYCKKYLETWNKSDAYLSVHPESTHNSAIRNSQRYYENPKIQEYLRVMLQDKVMTVEELVSQLAEIARGSKKDSDRIRALELLGRSKALFIDRNDITSQGNRISWNEFISQSQETKEK